MHATILHALLIKNDVHKYVFFDHLVFNLIRLQSALFDKKKNTSYSYFAVMFRSNFPSHRVDRVAISRYDQGSAGAAALSYNS